MSYLTMRLLTLELFKNSTDTQGKLRLNLHSLSVRVSEFLEYRRKKQWQQSYINVNQSFSDLSGGKRCLHSKESTCANVKH